MTQQADTLKAQVGAAADSESRMLLKTIRSRPSRARCLRILLTGLLTTAVDGTGCNWTPATNATATNSPVRQQRTGLDGPDLATDQKVAGSSARDVREMSEAPGIKAVTSAEVRRSAQEPARAAYPVVRKQRHADRIPPS
jgi:hypothetical protein